MFEKSIHGLSLFEITLDEVRYDNTAFFLINHVVILNKQNPQLCSWREETSQLYVVNMTLLPSQRQGLESDA